ncbi:MULTISPECIES: BREX-1 system phosphatase PglZ type A [unclassified Acinetobacter]|uniref:BREX-1 system phosphatase PglZ type A n=1 Tax=unclassified Acinetobacter TaxID=196816 RepID=UPI001C227684|nr:MULTISPECIES: BREX-1 system phosphatase PglZ type A [unclassified Acinetobacter]
MTVNRIQQALSRLFQKHRIVFWYDDKQELRDAFEDLSIEGVEKLEIQNNEFGIKYKLLREAPKQSFLLYKADKQPEPLQNWLLDIELANTTFRTDQVAIWLSELELPNEFAEIVEKHTAFFDASKAKVQAEKRKTTLKKLLSNEDTLSKVRLKMLAVCVGATQLADARIDLILEALLAELVNPKQEQFRLIQRCKLDDFFWQQVERFYGYTSEQPTIKDFAIELFKSCYSMGVNSPLNGDGIHLSSDALVFFKRWKDSRTHQEVFEELSDEYAELLSIEEDLNKRNLKEVIELDYFRLIDKKVLYELVKAVEHRTLSEGEVTLWCRDRRQGHWFSDFKYLYEAVDIASQFLTLLDVIQLNMATSSEAVQGYISHWYKLDQLYRQYIYCLKESSQNTLLNSLSEKVENLYTNRYLLPLNNAWQYHVDAMSKWEVMDVTPQNQFFYKWVKPYLDKNNKICVIISDAFRYEAGEEMVGRIRQEDRYQAKLDHALSSLPSYTQLGMASLLPQTDTLLNIVDNKTGTVNMGIQSTQGTENRDKVLKSALGERACTIQAKQMLEMTIPENRELIKAHDVVYIYHNRIDHTGDKMQSEGEAFEAVEKTFDDLMKLIKKLANANVNNLLITADHGFIYQNKPLEESDFLANDVKGEVLYNDRRFVLGKRLSCGQSLKAFTVEQLGLSGDVHAVIPKGAQRLRLSGSGSRFVHGGASLQEVIIPIISINKKRQSDLTYVDVDILRGGTNVITSGQLSVTLYQAEPVTDKIRPRQLRVGIYTENGTLISDRHDVLLDLSSESPRERELKLRFLLTQEADAANNQVVLLKLEEPEDGSNQYRKYKELRYTIRRSFTSDFDF